MLILVTGGTGFVGSNLRTHLSSDVKPDKQRSTLTDEQGHTWLFLGKRDLDLCDAEKVHEAFAKLTPSLVIHFAGNVGGLFKNLSENATMMRDNLLMNMNVIDACTRVKARVILMLSTCIFPEAHAAESSVEKPLTESCLHEGPPHPSNFGYAYAKRMMEIYARAKHRDHGLEYLCLSPTNLFGPHDHFTIDKSHVIPALIAKAAHNEVLEVRGTGAPERQFLYVDDLIRVIHYMTRTNWSLLPARHYIVAPWEQVSIAQAAEAIAKAFHASVTFTNNPNEDGQQRKYSSPELLQQVLGPDFQWTSFATGLLKTIEWYKMRETI